MGPKVKVTAKDDGAVISIDGFDRTITVKPSVEAPTSPTPSQIEPSIPTSRITIEYVKSMLEDYLDELDIREEVVSIVVKPKSFLGRDKFATIAAFVEELGGSYISAGKESRFIIPKQ